VQGQVQEELVEEESSKVESSPLSKAKVELESLRVKLTEGVDGRSQRKVLKQSEEYQKLKEKVKKLGKISNKILPASQLTGLQVEEIDAFTAWAQGALPSFITIKDLTQLANNQKAGGQRVGAFVLGLKNIAGGMTIDGTIYTGANSPFKYHEAFHGVFTLLLEQEEIVKYRSIARKEVRAKLRAEGKTFKTELEIFRNSADTYTDMTEKELMNEYYDEYLADEFEKFKMNPKKTKTSAEVKSLFTKILEFIKGIFSVRSQDELSTLFENIDAGKYQNAPIASNEFTNSLQEGITLEKNALVPYATIQKEAEGNIRTGYLYLDNDIADPMISSIAAMYLDKTSRIKEPTYSPAVVMDELMDDFAWMYNPSNSINLDKSDIEIQKLEEIEQAFDIYDEEIKIQVAALLNILGDQINESEYTLDELEDSTGLRSTSQYDIDASLIGGHTSLSSALKIYIATTTLSETDYFGNKELKEGETLITAVNFVEAYNGLLKSVKNITDPKLILQSMYFFGQENAQAGAVVNRLLQDVGVSVQELLSNSALSNISNPNLLQKILKGFENFRVDYIFNERDEAGNIRIYSAAERDDINSQLDRWNQAWINRSKLIKGNKTRKETTRTMLAEFETYLGISKQKLTNANLSDIATDFSKKLFDLVGIRLSPLYLQYSILQGRPKSTVKQKALVDLYAEETPLMAADINIMDLLIQDNEDIFDPIKGMDSKLKDISIHSAPFDETIGASVFKNPNGDLVYAHQKPTYHLKKIAELNDKEILEDLKLSDSYLKNNFLLNSPAFNKLSAENRLKIIRIAGSKVGERLASEEDLNENITGVKSTQTYGDFTAKEFALAVINNYAALLNPKSNKVESVIGTDATGNSFKRALAPILIRIMEASNTGDLISLPVIKAVDFRSGESVLSDKLINIYLEKVRTEFKRITLEATQIGNVTDPVLGYNNTEEGRAYKFVNNGKVLSGTLQDQLTEIAIREGKLNKEVSLESAMKEISSMNALKNNIKLNLEVSFDEFMQTLGELNMLDEISNNILEGPVNAAGVQRKELVDSARLLNLNYDTTHNLKQIFYNDWVNTGAINEILLGDQAVSLSSMVDRVKRAKMQNAAYDSAYSAISSPEQGVVHNVEQISLITLEEPIGTSTVTNKDIDKADAQMYLTTKAFRYMRFGFGKLSPAQATLIDNIEAGQQISSEDIFGTDNLIGLAKGQQLLNSKKLVYADGSTYLKMSAFVLTPEFTSLWDNTNQKWVAKPHRVRLHNLRVKLEAIENQPGVQTLGIAAPLTAIKMKKQRVNSLVELDNANPFTNEATPLDARYMGLQVVNPSNKLEILDTTQIKQIITSEQLDNVYVDALKLNVGQIRKAYNEAVSKRVLLNYKNKRNLVFTLDTALDELKVSDKEGGVTPNLAAFLNYAQEGLKASKSSQQILDFFSTTDGVQNYDLNNPLTVQKAEQLFLAYFSRGVLSEKAPGSTLTLLSDFGNKIYRKVYEVETIEVNGDLITRPVRSEVIRENDFFQNYNANELRDLNDLTAESKGLSKGVVVLDELRHGLMEYTDPKNKDTATGLRYTEMIMPAHYKSVMDLIENTPSAKLPSVISKMFGVRIPSQDNHSAINMKMVDFMPAYYGSTAMFAQELVEISGADFDIDKVFALMKEFYVEEGEFKEYGTGDLYSEYIKYTNEKVNQSGSIYSEALSLFAANELDGATNLTDLQMKAARKAGLQQRTITALQTLGLPITTKQFSDYNNKHGVPFAAPLNNEILDYRYALIGNKGVTESKDGKTPISYQAANTDVLWDPKSRTGILAELAEDIKIFADRIEEDNVDVDNLAGKIKAFAANKGASIGAVVSPNLYLSLLTEYKIQVKKQSALYINGKFYGNYGVTVLENGGRKQDVISALITMATDNAKLRLVSKLGLNRHAVGLLTNMIALGVPLKTSLLLINNPKVQELYSLALNKKNKLDAGIEKLVSDEMDNLKLNKKIKLKNINDALLTDAINNPEDVSNEELYSILNLFNRASQLKKFTGKMGAATSLTKGLGSTMAEVNDSYNKISELFAEDAPMDLKSIYKTKTWQNTYLQIFIQIRNSLLPATFISASRGFNKILDPALKQMDTSNTDFNEEVMSKVRLDLLSYLTIKAFQKNGLDNNPQSVATLSNDIIYPTDLNSIVDIIERLRTTPEGKDNFFLDNYVITTEASDSPAGFNQANSNTFRQLNAGQKIQLQNDFAKLYGALETRNDAMSIVNYEMVKGGLQLGYGSILSVMSPVVLTTYLDQIPSVEKALRDELKYEDVFGASIEDLTQDFVNGYLLSNANNSKLETYETDEIRPLRDGLSFNIKTKEAQVSLTAEGVEPRKYFRIGVSSVLAGTIYRTYRYNTEKSTKENYIYDEVDTMGSNQQNGIGFMFGERPTYREVRTYVKDNGGVAGVRNLDVAKIEQEINEMTFDETKRVQTESLQNDNAIITATDTEVTVSFDEESNGVNIADISQLISQRKDDSEAVRENELETNVIEDVDQAIPETTPEQEQLTLDLKFELADTYDVITDEFDTIVKDKAARLTLINQNLFPLSLMIEAYESRMLKDSTKSSEESQKDFIDNIKRCILK